MMRNMVKMLIKSLIFFLNSVQKVVFCYFCSR